MSPHFASADTGERTTGPESGSPETTKTPLFAANHADRYQRQTLDRWQSVQSYLDAYSVHAKAIKADRDDIVAQIMLGKLDPATLRSCESAVKRARQAAENLLKRGMFRDGGNWTSTVTELLDTGRWLSHGQMISWEDACDPQIGLVVQHLPYRSKEWQDYWRLYCLQSLAIADRQKLYESASVSLVIGPTEAT